MAAASAAAAALFGFSLYPAESFAVHPAAQPRAARGLASPRAAAWEPHASAAEPAGGEASTALKAFAFSATIGLAAGAVKSRTSRRAANFKTPEETYKTVIAGGEARLAMTPREVLLQGIITGFYIGFGGVLCATVGGSVGSRLPPGLQRFLFGAFGFPLSIFLTTIAGGQGFTPNVSVMATSLLREGTDSASRDARFSKMMKNLAIAYAGNTIGLVTIAWLANVAALPAVPAAIHIAKHKVFDLNFMEVVVRGVLGGWLIGLAVWTSQAAEEVSSKFVTIWLCISTYVICQYEHCLANLFFVPCAIFAGAKITWGQFIMLNLIPSTIGNALGGFGMLACMLRLVYGKHGKDAVPPAVISAPAAAAPAPATAPAPAPPVAAAPAVAPPAASVAAAPAPAPVAAPAAAPVVASNPADLAAAKQQVQLLTWATQKLTSEGSPEALTMKAKLDQAMAAAEALNAAALASKR